MSRNAPLPPTAIVSDARRRRSGLDSMFSSQLSCSYTNTLLTQRLVMNGEVSRLVESHIQYWFSQAGKGDKVICFSLMASLIVIRPDNFKPSVKN